ncbi:hypothetical protein BV898_04811 [Hypsibius exemplaris]|uniref:Enoyl reductase (ER) domain-containing protein n=1 Tax=Hypsibius exemplaris TaxID=2072580 RepID=A0A1W0X1S0_HYPEX|nr:hypothetical protein BV898_04811 [Hypsibius exemplaris]
MEKLSLSCLDERAPTDRAVPSVPHDGVRIRVCYAGLCYLPLTNATPLRKGCTGYRNGNLFEGFEISGIVESIGTGARQSDLTVGDPVAVFPHEDVICQGYADYLVVRELKNVVKLPASISLAVGAMLPTGGTLAMSAVIRCRETLANVVAQKGHCNIVIMGAGCLAHWLIRLLALSNSAIRDRIHIAVASDDWEGLKIARTLGAEEVVLLDENCHEEVLAERLRDSFADGVQMAISLCPDERLQDRAIRCLDKGGFLVVPSGSISGDFQNGKKQDLQVLAAPCGSVEILRTLVRTIADGEGLQKNHPTYKVYPVETSQTVFDDLQLCSRSERAILKFQASHPVVW